MDYETLLGEAIDAMADDDTSRAEALLQALIDHIKGALDGTLTDAERYYAWGRALRLMDEPEQALLRLEQSLGLNANHEGVLWETASILLDDLDRAAAAQTLLESKLIPMRPGEDLYQEALDMAKLRQKLAKTPPKPPAGKTASGAAKPNATLGVEEDDEDDFEEDLDDEADFGESFGDNIDLGKGPKRK